MIVYDLPMCVYDVSNVVFKCVCTIRENELLLRRIHEHVVCMIFLCALHDCGRFALCDCVVSLCVYDFVCVAFLLLVVCFLSVRV